MILDISYRRMLRPVNSHIPVETSDQFIIFFSNRGIDAINYVYEYMCVLVLRLMLQKRRNNLMNFPEN